VSCGCVLENRTLFKGIHVLPTASAWSFRSGSIERKSTYFQSLRVGTANYVCHRKSYHQAVRQVFSTNLPRYLNGRDRIGMSLTGGLDTRMVMAWQQSRPGSLPCYTYGGPYRECRDVTVARQVAGTCGQPHEVISVGKEFFSRFPHYAERSVFLTDGCVLR